MLITKPLMFHEYSNHIESANVSDFETTRNESTIEHAADFTCPVTTGIFFEN